MKHTSIEGLFTDIADSIREKKGTSNQIVADNFPEEIDGITGGTNIQPLTTPINIGTESMIADATLAGLDGYNPITITPVPVWTETITVTPSEKEQTVSPPIISDCKYMSSVKVEPIPVYDVYTVTPTESEQSILLSKYTRRIDVGSIDPTVKVSNTTFTSGNWGMAYGNGVFVAIKGNSTEAMYSTDGGINWYSSTLPGTTKEEPFILFNDWGFFYGDVNNQYYSSRTGIWMSSDGGSTLPASWPGSAALNGAWAANRYIYYISNNKVYWGLPSSGTWNFQTQTNFSANQSPGPAAYGKGAHVSYSSIYGLYYTESDSPDFIKIDNCPISSNLSISSTTYCQDIGRFAICNTAQIAVSDTCYITPADNYWQVVSSGLPTSQIGTKVYSDGKRFYLSPYKGNGSCYWSNNGINWKSTQLYTSFTTDDWNCNGAAAGNNSFLVYNPNNCKVYILKFPI